MKNKNVLLAALTLMIVALAGFAIAQESPVLTLELSSYDPVPAEPGKLVDVWINLQNAGGRDATGIVIEFENTSAFSLVSENDRTKTIPVLGAYKDYAIKYTVRVSEDVAEGPNDLVFSISTANTQTVIIERVAIDVKSTETAVSITDISLTPAPVSAGGKTTLLFNVANLAKSSSIRNVDVSVMITPVVSGTNVVDLPFVTINSGNQKSIDRIAPGQNGEFRFDLAVYPEAESRIYKLPVSVSYYDDTGRQYNRTILVGVEVNEVPDLLVTLENADINSKDMSGEVLFNIINRGTSNVKLMTLTLKETDQYGVLSPSNQLYLGNIDSDDFETARFNVEAFGEEVTFDVELKYMDALNNEYTQTHTVSYALQAPESQQRSSAPLIILLLVIVVVVVLVIRRRNKRK